MTPATARSHRKSSVVPRVARRVSGPVRPRAVPAPAGGATASVVTRARAAADHRLLDRLLRSRAWIWALGILLGGIVAMQVSLLKLNSGISRAVETTATLERQNGALENAIGRLGATTRIQTGAKSLGLVMPAPADVTYLRSRSSDPARALRVMTAPSDEAAALMANNGIVPGSLVATAVPQPATATAAPEPATTTTAPQPATATAAEPATTTTAPQPATATAPAVTP